MFCTNCGKQLDESALFCPHCGAKVGAAAAAPAPEQAAPVSPFAPPPAPEAFAPQAEDAQQAYQAYAPQTDEAQQAYQAYAPQADDAQQAYQAYAPQASDAQQAWQAAAPQNSWQQPYEATPVQAKKKRGKGLVIGLGCLLVAVLVVGAIWFLNRKSGRDNPVEKLTAPADNSYAALCDYVEELPNLNKLLRNAKALEEGDNLKASLRFHMGSPDNGEAQFVPAGFDLNLELAQDKSKQRTRLQADVQVQGIEIPLRLYMDPEQLQLALPGILNEDEVLSLPLKDLPAKWNASALGKLVGAELPENLDLSGLAASDPIDSLEKFYGEDWTRFYDSLEVVPYEGSSRFDRGETLTLRWDKAALQTLLDKTELDMNETLDLEDTDLSSVGAQMVVNLLGELEKNLEDLQFCKENDMLTGLYAKTAEGGVELRLCGEGSPWEHITVDVENDGEREGADIRLVKGGGQLRLEAVHTRNGEDAGDNPVAIVYNDADGLIRFEGTDMDENAPELRLLPADQGFSLRIKQETSSENVDVDLTLSGEKQSVEQLGGETKDLLSMSQTELQGLLMRIMLKIQNMTQGQ